MSSLRILHLANDFAGSEVYKNLVAALDQRGFTQIRTLKLFILLYSINSPTGYFIH